MEIADAQKFLQENHRACIAVRQRDGWPQMTFVTPGIDPEGRVIITSRGTTYKIKHIRRDPRVSMLIFGEISWDCSQTGGILGALLRAD